MSPVDSDLFLSADFAATFAKLDSVPGTTIVANYAALTALTWGIPQHGSKVLQADNGAEWYWYNPSGTGVWKRSNTIGLLNYTVQSAPVSTVLITSPGPTFITSGNFTIPGGRPVHVHLNMGLDNSSGLSGIVIVTLKDNGTQVAEFNYRPGSSINGAGDNQHAHLYLNTPAVPIANNTTHNITAQIRSATLSAGVGGHGTSVARVSTLAIHEV
jgi:hypothetical protein